MKNVLLLIALLFSFSFSQEVVVSKDKAEKLGIKTVVAKYKEYSLTKTCPAVVNEDPTLSYGVSSSVDGIVENLYVKQGDLVKKGQVLLTVYSPKIADIQANIEMAKVKVDTARQVLEREEMLYKEEVIPYVRYYNAKIEYQKAVGELNALRKILSSYGEIKGNSVVLRSKVNGFIADLKVIKGSPVNVGQEIMYIHSHERLWVIAQLPFQDAQNLKIGQKVYIKTPTGKKVEGILTYINHEIDPKTRRNDVRIVVNNVRDLLKPNLFVNVEIPVSSVKGLVVPSSSVFRENGKDYCFVKTGNKFILREVQIGNRDDKEAVVLSGIKEGEEVVYSGVIFLRSSVFGGGGE
ncbi:efflux RND transporter periplasmic adaptor subunit [Sulfurihydrogenibium azorense]|uniref:efflux RND transporter periplasmic adaptor subunit n=1 Tax=Sulfurihydrogenibium azorense TaxID=309806 RepID=UPI00240A2759|nr:efflux RND transporter periplasmic adaptor subunit [Sulfurihydrogenibium azorense]MDM7274096.1 efflux RND transporter periplasmic adaptor subunit [Sulfurihydrogenibium azorense]